MIYVAKIKLSRRSSASRARRTVSKLARALSVSASELFEDIDGRSG